MPIANVRRLVLTVPMLVGAMLAAPTFFASDALAQNGDEGGNVRAGRELAVNTCAECHMVIVRHYTKPKREPPPDFVEVANAPGTTARALYVFLHTPHPTMPNLILSDQESANVIAYILSLKKPGRT